MTLVTIRRSTALLAGSVLLATPVLGACGFNYATDKVNTIAAGVNDREGDVDVLGAVIVGTAEGQGVFEATLVNNLVGQGAQRDADTRTLESISGDSIKPAGFEPVEIAPAAAINFLKSDRGIALTGDFGVGNFVPVTLTFSDGQVSMLNVPVVRPCFAYEGIAYPSPTPTDSASDSASDSSSDGASDGASDDATATTEPSPDPSSSTAAPTDSAVPEVGDSSVDVDPGDQGNADPYSCSEGTGDQGELGR